MVRPWLLLCFVVGLHACTAAPSKVQTATEPAHTVVAPWASAPSNVPAAEPASPCLDDDLERDGRVDFAGAEDEGLAFCVQQGFTAEDGGVCLHFDPATASWTPSARSFSRDFVDPALPADDSSALVRSAAGTMTVCGAKERCATVSFRPPNKDAFDELMIPWPSIGLDGDRVLVAWQRNSSRQELALEIWDVAKRTVVKRAQLEGYGTLLGRVGPQSALLVLCKSASDEPICHAAVVDMRSLATTPTSIRLAEDPRQRKGQLQPVADGMVLVDQRASELVWLSRAGVVTRRVALDTAEVRSPIVGRISHDRLAILERAPHAGRGVLVDLGSGKLTAIAAPRCATR